MKCLYMLIIASLTLLTSCSYDVKMNTTIRKDGTCKRELFFKTDSLSLVNPVEPSYALMQGVLDNDAWVKTWFLNEESGEKPYPMTQADYQAVKAELQQLTDQAKKVRDTVRVHAQREFVSVGEMADSLPFFFNEKRIQSKASLEKHFHWFYTDYVYTETFGSLAPQFDLPLTDFINEVWASYYLTGSPNLMEGKSVMEVKDQLDSVETQFANYVCANQLNDVIKLLAEHYEQIENAPMSRDEFLARRDDIIGHFRKSSKIDVHSDNEVIKILTKEYETDVYERFVEKNEDVKNLWDQRQNLYYSLFFFDVDYVLSMPGTMRHECSDGVVGADGLLHSRLTGLRLLVPDYTIQATSKVTNYWAIMLSLFIGLQAVMSLFYHRKR